MATLRVKERPCPTPSQSGSSSAMSFASAFPSTECEVSNSFQKFWPLNSLFYLPSILLSHSGALLSLRPPLQRKFGHAGVSHLRNGVLLYASAGRHPGRLLSGQVLDHPQHLHRLRHWQHCARLLGSGRRHVSLTNHKFLHKYSA